MKNMPSEKKFREHPKKYGRVLHEVENMLDGEKFDLLIDLIKRMDTDEFEKLTSGEKDKMNFLIQTNNAVYVRSILTCISDIAVGFNLLLKGFGIDKKKILADAMKNGNFEKKN